MAGTIFVRERRKVIKGEKKPRYRVVGVSGDSNVKINSKHLRKTELDQIVAQSGAAVVYCDQGKGSKDGKG